MPGPVFVRDDRVELRPIEDEDRPHLQRVRNDPQTRVSAGGPPEPFDEHEMDDYMEWLRADDTVALAICRDGEYVGMVTLKRISRPDDTANAGVHVVPDERGNGYATAACELLFDYAFDELGLHRICAYAYEFNDPSQSLLEKLGFTHEGVRREARFARGSRHDVHTYGLLAREWRERRQAG
ncbi:GNAT family N-acetyltransferase [Haloarchaeobius sp. TZWWS8]|uniref:GNAT family N-acetyltransferase n=1 Tax=Haloarchaeobius sp. TZWWS8 TaxID=3446121 RepID=UPI003EC04208